MLSILHSFPTNSILPLRPFGNSGTNEGLISTAPESSVLVNFRL